MCVKIEHLPEAGGLDRFLVSSVSCDFVTGLLPLWASISPFVKQGAGDRQWLRSLPDPRCLGPVTPPLCWFCQRVGAISCFRYKICL